MNNLYFKQTPRTARWPQCRKCKVNHEPKKCKWKGKNGYAQAHKRSNEVLERSMDKEFNAIKKGL